MIKLTPHSEFIIVSEFKTFKDKVFIDGQARAQFVVIVF